MKPRRHLTRGSLASNPPASGSLTSNPSTSGSLSSALKIARLATVLGLGAGLTTLWVFPASAATPPVVAQNGSVGTSNSPPSSRPSTRATLGNRPQGPGKEHAAETAVELAAESPTSTSNQVEKPGKPESSPPSPARPGSVPDLGKLRADYDRIREELFKARVRSQKVADGVYPSRLDLRLRWKGGPDFVVAEARFLLDGAELWDSADGGQTDDLIQVAERSVRPGPHALTVHLKIRPKTEAKGGTKTGADKLGYTSEHTFAIVVAETGHTHLRLTGDEDGSPPEYDPELELEIETDK